MVELIKIGIIFFVVLVLTFKKLNLWISLLVATLLLGLLFHLPIQTILMDLLTSVLDKKTLLLILALVAILFFSNLLKETGRMDEILEGFRHILKDIRVVIALLPAMIGLMPLMGGALVSAPMVVEGSDELKLSAERRTFINFWFRHLWQYILPTYPSLILAATLLGIPIRKLGWINLPFTLTAIISGALVGFWGVQKSMRIKNLSDTPSGWRLFKNLFPLLFGLILVIGFKVELAYAFGLTILGMIIFYRIGGRVVLKGFKDSLSIELLLTVAIVMGFKKVLESSKAILSVSTILSSSGVPFWLIAILIPLLIGVMTGLTIAPMAIGFPILIPLFQDDPNFLNYMMLAYASGISGDLLSPFHLCLVLTKDYFKADLKGVYRFIWIPVTSILMVGFLITILFKAS
jgi:integral membrane protein (TIGR00529 family)